MGAAGAGVLGTSAAGVGSVDCGGGATSDPGASAGTSLTTHRFSTHAPRKTVSMWLGGSTSGQVKLPSSRRISALGEPPACRLIFE